MLSEIQAKLPGLVRSTWAQDVQTWGERVALYREYAAGDHRANLTEQMRKMLRVKDTRLDRFNANYCSLIPQAMNDRLTVTAIEGDSQEATEWAAGIQATNRFDALQMDVHEAALIDGDTFFMSVWSETEGRVVWAHEPAYDGDVGLIPVYDRMRRKLVAAIKIWWEGDAKRVNFYYPGKIEKYIWEGNEQTPPQWALKLETSAVWVDQKNAANGVPVIHFKNRASTYAWHGESELVNAIPLQDVLNRTITSMVMTSELSAFPIRFAVGFKPPAQVQPGENVYCDEEIPKDVQPPRYETMAQATLVPFIEEANFVIDQIGSVTMTPLPSSMGSSASSGEALKERTVGLIGKVSRAQTRFGNGWEDVMALSARMQEAYGTETFANSEMWRTKWKDASPRNETETVKNAMLTLDITGRREALREVGKVRGYDEKKIDAIMAEMDEEASKALRQTGLPGFNMFGEGTDLNQPLQQNGNQQPGQIDPNAIEAALAQLEAV